MPKSRNAPTTFDEWMGQVIEGRMKKRGHRQKDLSAMTGIPDSLVGRIIRGTRQVTVREFEVIAGVLNYPAAEMLDEALSEFGGMEKLLDEYAPKSEPVTNIADYRKPDLATAPEEELKRGSYAAGTDKELEQDEHFD